jgi:hypothetical protein
VEQKLRNLFWVQLKPCGWQHTELEKFQSFASGTELAISEYPDEIKRQEGILQICEKIVADIRAAITRQDESLALVRRLLLEAPEGQDITVNEIVWNGRFSIVCQGFIGRIQAAIKVLKWVPMSKLTEDLLKVGEERKKLDDPSFVRLHDIFQVSTEMGSRAVFVSEYLGDRESYKRTLLSTVLKEKGPFQLDTTARLLGRMATGLAALHNQPFEAPGGVWGGALGLLTPDKIHYNQLDQRLRVPPFGVSSFLWNVLPCPLYELWIDQDSGVYFAPEQRQKPAGEYLTAKSLLQNVWY